MGPDACPNDSTGHLDAALRQPARELARRGLGWRAERLGERLRIGEVHDARGGTRRTCARGERGRDELGNFAHEPLLVEADAIPLEQRELRLVPAPELVVAKDSR